MKLGISIHICKDETEFYEKILTHVPLLTVDILRIKLPPDYTIGVVRGMFRTFFDEFDGCTNAFENRPQNILLTELYLADPEIKNYA